MAVPIPQRQIRLKIVDSPNETRVVLRPLTLRPFYAGTDRNAPNYVCGNCEHVFMTGTSTLLLHCIIECPTCGSFNDADWVELGDEG